MKIAEVQGGRIPPARKGEKMNDVAMRVLEEMRQKGEKDFANIGLELNSVPLNNKAANNAMERLFQEELAAEREFVNQHPLMEEYSPAILLLEEMNADKPIQITEHTYLKKDGSGLMDKDGNEVSNFVVENFRLLVDFDDSRVQEYIFDVRLRSGRKYSLQMSVEEFRRGDWCEELHGLSCKQRRLLGEYCRKLSSNSRVEELYQTKGVGWVQDPKSNKFFFVTESGEVTGEVSSISPKIAGAELIPSPDLNEIDVAKSFLEMRNLTRSPVALIMMVYTVMAVMYSLFKYAVGAPKFLLALVGEASTGKTSLAMAIVNLYRRSRSTEPLNSLRSTITSIEQNLAYFKDSVMVVDDLYPAESNMQKNKLETTLESVIRMFGDASAKKRSRAFENYETQGLALLTGEYFAGGTSSLSRCMQLKLQKGDVNFELLSVYQNERKMVPSYFLWNFVKFCTVNQSKIIAKLRNTVERIRREKSPEFSKERTANIEAYMAATMDVMLEYFYSIALYDSMESQNRNGGFLHILENILYENERMMEESSPKARMLMFLKSILEEDSGKLVNVKACNYTSNYYIWKEYLFVYPVALVADMKNQSKSTGLYLDVNESIIKNLLKDEGLLCKTKEGETNRFSTKVPFAKKMNDNRRFYKISIERLRELGICVNCSM